VQNAAARLVTGARRSDHVMTVLRQLHWLPVHQQVTFKIAGLVHQSLAGAAIAYLADDCHLLSDAGRRPLRSHSNDICKLLVPRTHNKLGDGSFSAAGPRLERSSTQTATAGTFLRFFQTIFENTSLWRLKCLVTLLTYRCYINKCIYLSICIINDNYSVRSVI